MTPPEEFRGRMNRAKYCHGWGYLPTPLVVLRKNGIWTRVPMRAIVDTGAAFNMAHADVAGALQLKPDDLRRESPGTFEAGGVAGSMLTRRIKVDIAILSGRDEDPDRAFQLLGANLFVGEPPEDPAVAPAAMPFNLLLGQHTTLEQLMLIHANSRTSQRYVLRRFAE